MDNVKGYLLSIICAALICGILSGLVQSGFARDLLKMICGLCLTLCILRPLSRIRWEEWLDFTVPYEAEARQTAAMGEKMAAGAMSDIIKQRAEAYILDKAASLNAELEIEIILNVEQIPASATLSGKVSPYAKRKLEAFLETDLGITKENQRWTG